MPVQPKGLELIQGKGTRSSLPHLASGVRRPDPRGTKRMRPPGIKNGSRTNQVFEFIQSEIARTGTFPSNAAIRDRMGWKTLGAVQDTLIRLAGQRRLRPYRNSVGKTVYAINEEAA